MLKGLPPLSRSSKANKAHSKSNESNEFARAFPVANCEVAPCNIPGFETRLRRFGIPTRIKYHPPSPPIDSFGAVAPEIAEKFRFVDPYITRLVDDLASPTGHRVALLCTGPGSGKSTHLIYRLRISTLGDSGRLLITQPRTVTMRQPKEKGFEDTSAGFIAKHLLNLTGKEIGREMSMLYRGTTTEHDRHTKILFVTEEILSNWLSDGNPEKLAHFGVLVIDDAHELSNPSEFCLMLQLALQQYPHLRLVIASATMDEAMFVDYFGGSEKVLVVKPFV